MKNPYINPLTSLAIIIGLPLSALVLGALAIAFSSSYERICTPDNKCTTNLKYGGWSAVPLEGIVGVLSTGSTLVFAFYKGSKSEPKEEPSSDLPS